jgi:hypothetical protein
MRPLSNHHMVGATVLAAAGVAQALAPTAVLPRIGGMSMVASVIQRDAPLCPTRRTALRRAAELAVCYGAAFAGARRAAAESDAAGRRLVPDDDMEFHMQWSYAKPQDILPYIYATARRGQVDEILKAMDEFGRYPCPWHSPADHLGGHEQLGRLPACMHARTLKSMGARSARKNGRHYPMYKLGDEKGKILEKEIAKMDTPPKNALELGTFLGYSALRTARRLAPGGKLHCIGALSLSRARASSTLLARMLFHPFSFLPHTHQSLPLSTHLPAPSRQNSTPTTQRWQPRCLTTLGLQTGPR